jgi:hypothetical protein
VPHCNDHWPLDANSRKELVQCKDACPITAITGLLMQTAVVVIISKVLCPVAKITGLMLLQIVVETAKVNEANCSFNIILVVLL